MNQTHVDEAKGFRQIEAGGELIYLMEGADHTDGIKTFAIPKRQLKKFHDRGSNISLAQFFGNVVDGLVSVSHVFKGLRRPLCDGDDMQADKNKLALSWSCAWDWWWNEARRFESSGLEFREAPEGKVFVVNVSPNSNKTLYPMVDYWIERWYWVRRSTTLIDAPVDWETRYDQKLK